MKSRLLSLCAVCLMICSAAAAQQNNRSAYFMDSYAYRYRFNPAFGVERGHFSLALGNFSVAPESNLGLSSILYPASDGTLDTFLSKNVDSSTALGKFSKKNMIHAGVDLDLLSIAFKAKNSSHFIDLGIRSNTYLNLPYDIFRFLKEGSSNGNEFVFDNMGVKSSNYVEFAYGFSRRLTERVNIGARFKFLAGLAQASLELSNTSIITADDQWTVQADGMLTTCLPNGFVIGTKEGSDEIDFSNISQPEDYSQALIPPAGLGVAMDLGATFDIIDGLQASLSLTDLGIMKWGFGMKARTVSEPVYFSGFNSLGAEDSDIENQAEELLDDFLDCLALHKFYEDDVDSPLEMTVNAGLRYNLPFYPKLSAGMLLAARINGPFSWTETRGIVNWQPFKFIGISLSAAESTFGPSAGGSVNIILGPLNIFAGVDSYLPLLDMTPQYIPVGRLNTNATVGLTLVGRKNNKKS